MEQEKIVKTERETTFLIACNNCFSPDLKKWDERNNTRNTDWFICKTCGHKFPLKKASYIGGYV